MARLRLDSFGEQCVAAATQRAARGQLTLEDILWALIQPAAGMSRFWLDELGVDVKDVQTQLESLRRRRAKLTPIAISRLVAAALREARLTGCQYIGPEHLLLVILRRRTTRSAKLLIDAGARYRQTAKAIRDYNSGFCALDLNDLTVTVERMRRNLAKLPLASRRIARKHLTRSSKLLDVIRRAGWRGYSMPL